MGTARAQVTLFLDRIDGTTLSLGTSIDTGTVFLRTKALDMGQQAFVKFIEKILYNIRDRKGNPDLKLEIWGSDDEEENFELLDTLLVDSEDPGFTDPPGRRYYQLKFTDVNVRKRWSVHGLEIYGEIGGEEF